MNTILFDLDGTLLPMNQDAFLMCYFEELGKFAHARGHDAKSLIKAVQKATVSMLANDGGALNDERFWESFSSIVGEENARERLEPVFERFYENEYDAVCASTLKNPAVNACIELLREKGYALALATNPLFPPMAVQKRIAWAGLDADMFEHVTTYDNATFCKPNADYYLEILARLEKEPSDCLMVGNDVSDDMAARAAGLDVYLITDCLINDKNLPTDGFKQGSFEEFYAYAKALPKVG